jgi:O-antigen/teichoic acid export membrane protein
MVLPRMFSFVSTAILTCYLKEEYGKLSVIFAFMIFFNVILAYGMETAFFRFIARNPIKARLSKLQWFHFWTAFLFIAHHGVIYLNGPE